MTSKAKIKELKTLKAGMRRFVLHRIHDATGTSGEGIVAVGTQYMNGLVSLTWLSHLGTMAWYNTIEIVKALHGHQGGTEIIWLDKEVDKEITLEEDTK
jgi:hypothetical protein